MRGQDAADVAGRDECACCVDSSRVRNELNACVIPDIDCVGTWSGTCTSGCVLSTWVETVAQSGQGMACLPWAQSCPPGEGDCPVQPVLSTGALAGLLCIICVLLAGMWMARPAVVACVRRRREEREARQQREEEQAKREAEQAKAKAPRITFVVKELTGKSTEVSTLSTLHTVAELKEAVAAASGGEAARLQLVFKNVPLEDGSTLESCGVGEGSEVNAVAKDAAQEELLP